MKIRLNAFFPKSPKARVFLAVLVLLIAPIFLFFFSAQKPELPITKTDDSLRLARTKELAKLNQDSDEDGLKDWEEQIYGTDPKKADTDGDKTLDGEEIKLNRDPLKPGPKDKLPQPAALSKETARKDANNLTQKLTDRFEEKFMRPLLDNQSLKLSEEELSQEILKDLPNTPSIQLNYFTEKDLNILKTDTPENFLAYGKEFNKIVNDSFGSLPVSEIIIFSEALQAEDLSQLVVLDTYLATYNNAMAKLNKIPVPPGLTNLHLAYLNATKRQQIAVEKMRKAEEDIVKSTYGAQEYIAAGNEIASIEQKLQKTFTERKF